MLRSRFAKTLIIGASHTAALRLAWRASPGHWPRMDLTFAALQGEMTEFQVNDQTLTAQDPTKLHRLTGQTQFDLTAVDVQRLATVGAALDDQRMIRPGDRIQLRLRDGQAGLGRNGQVDGRQIEIRTCPQQHQARVVEIALPLLLGGAQRIEQAVAAIHRNRAPATGKGNGLADPVGSIGPGKHRVLEDRVEPAFLVVIGIAVAAGIGAREAEAHPVTVIAGLERGELAPPSEETTRKIAEDLGEDPDMLLAAEGFNMDPTLAKMRTDGTVATPEGVNPSEWLMSNKWTADGVVPQDNRLVLAQAPYIGLDGKGADTYRLTTYDSATNSIINFDGTAYDPVTGEARA